MIDFPRLQWLRIGVAALLCCCIPAWSQTPPQTSLQTSLQTSPQASSPRSLLFIGNSFTFAANSSVLYYRHTTVTDLNEQGIGGVPALFKSFADEAGLRYDVSLETHPGAGLDWHLENRSVLIGSRPYDAVVMHGYSTLDAKKPGDPTVLVDATRTMARLLKKANPNVQVYMTATWARPDMVYPDHAPWHGKGLEAMAGDVRSGYDRAAKASGDVAAVIPVGQAFIRAIRGGVADADPYDGIDAGKVDLWSYDHYHASVHGYYLEALMVFGRVTGRDPRSLGDHECSAHELGLSPEQAHALQQVAFDELVANGGIEARPLDGRDPDGPIRCRDPR